MPPSYWRLARSLTPTCWPWQCTTAARYGHHLLERNQDFRAIHELLGHKDVITTMIYTH